MDETGGWSAVDGGETIGETGSEGGVILRDDEYRGGARITVERGGGTTPFIITCGVYGWMVHTRFFSTLGDAEREYAGMRGALAAIVGLIPLAADPDADARMDAVSDAISGFVDRFP